MWKYLALLFQIGDYALKAMRGFAETETGSREWDDVERGLVDCGFLDSATMSDGSAYPADVPQWVSDAEANGWGGIGQVRSAQPIQEIPAVPLNARQRAAAQAEEDGRG